MITQALFLVAVGAAMAQNPAASTDIQFLAQLQSPAAAKPAKRASLDGAAAEAFERFKAAARIDPNALGFRDAAEILAARLGQPLPIYSVLTEPLSTFDGTQDPNALLMSAGKVYYPITVEGSPRSSLTLLRNGADWTLGPLDDDPPAREIVAARAALAPLPSDLVFIVSVGALRRHGYFVGRRGDAKNVQEADPTKAATELVAAKPSPSLGIGSTRATLDSWLRTLSAFGQKAAKWSREKGKDSTPPAPAAILPLYSL